MKWFWNITGFVALALFAYWIYAASAPKPPAKQVLHEGKAVLLSKTKDHNALWVHYRYNDAAGEEHEMSEKVAYIDLWESFKAGQEVEIIYDNEGRSVLKAKAGDVQADVH